jgi:hypothetical protein
VTNQAIAAHLSYATQLAIGLVFAISTVAKLRRPALTVRTIESYGLVPARVLPGFTAGLIVAELTVALALLSGWARSPALLLALIILIVFFAATTIVLRQGRRVPCGCFGEKSEEVSRRSLMRLVLLITAAIFATIAPATPGAQNMLAGNMKQAASYLLEMGSVSVALILIGIWILESPRLAVTLRTMRERNGEARRAREARAA